MDFNKIQEQLNTEFQSSSRKIVFWYDDNKEFKDDINDLELDNAKLLVLSGNDYFKTKYLLEVEDTTSNYLLYAPFNRPDNELNPLLDMMLYSKQFSADYITLLADDLGVPRELKNSLLEYDSFFKNKSRLKAFKELNGNYRIKSNIDLAIMSVLTKTKVINFEEILKSIITLGLENNKYLSDIEKFGSINVFWGMCKRYYGYNDDQPNLGLMLSKMFVTVIYDVSEVSLPNNFDQYILPKISETKVFIDNFKNNVQTKESFEELSLNLSRLLNIKDFVSKLKFENFKSNDVFKEFDEMYIKYLIDYATNQLNLELIDDYITVRENTHYYQNYVNEYQTIKYAFKLLKEINKFDQTCHSITIHDYTDDYAIIDKYYHLYIYHYNKLNIEINELNELIENKYNNIYLDRINQYWDTKLLEYGNYESIPGYKQTEFYSNSVYHSLNEGKTCVIISDALRYECGMIVNDHFNNQPQVQSTIIPMISTVPSYTQLGMAALLPNMSGIEINNDYSVTIKGKKTNGIDSRNTILSGYNKDAIAIQYEDIKNLNKSALRDELKNKKLVYVYHNQIDARGDHALTENEVFDAAQDTINELDYAIRRLRGDTNFVRFFITADHGFMYRRKQLVESDKIDVSRVLDIYTNKRYIYSQQPLNQDGMIEFRMNYLNSNNNVYAYVPKGGNIFKTPGAGQNYVHGGASLQEIVIPLIEIKTTQRRVETDSVNVELICSNFKITSLLAQFNFVQVEVVSDVVLARQFNVVFVDDNNQPISNECIINANVKTDDMSKRTTTCKFNFINQQYDSRKDYYMVIKSDGIEYKRVQFIMDTAFSNGIDFDF